MDSKTFHENFTVDRKAKGVRATPKNTPVVEPEIQTADGAIYEAAQTYFFFDEQTREIQQSTGFRRVGEYLSTFGLKVVSIAKLRSKRDAALSDGQLFFKLQIELLQTRIKEFELEKPAKPPKVPKKK